MDEEENVEVKEETLIEFEQPKKIPKRVTKKRSKPQVDIESRYQAHLKKLGR